MELVKSISNSIVGSFLSNSHSIRLFLAQFLESRFGKIGAKTFFHTQGLEAIFLLANFFILYMIILSRVPSKKNKVLILTDSMLI